jgi:hypothetical protein
MAGVGSMVGYQVAVKQVIFPVSAGFTVKVQA